MSVSKGIGVAVLAVIVSAVLLHARQRIVVGDSFGGRALFFTLGDAVNAGELEVQLNSPPFMSSLGDALDEHMAVSDLLHVPRVGFKAWVPRGNAICVSYHLPLYSVCDFELLELCEYGMQTTETARLNADVEQVVVLLIRKLLRNRGLQPVFVSKRQQHDALLSPGRTPSGPSRCREGIPGSRE